LITSEWELNNNKKICGKTQRKAVTASALLSKVQVATTIAQCFVFIKKKEIFINTLLI